MVGSQWLATLREGLCGRECQGTGASTARPGEEDAERAVGATGVTAHAADAEQRWAVDGPQCCQKCCQVADQRHASPAPADLRLELGLRGLKAFCRIRGTSGRSSSAPAAWR